MVLVSVADTMLEDYVSTGRLDPSDVTANLGAAVLRSERLTFIGQDHRAQGLAWTPVLN